MKKYISSDTLCNLAEAELKNNAFKFGKKALKKKREIAIGTKFAPPYSICLWWSQKSKFSEKQNLNRIFGGGILMIYSPLGEEKLKSFIDNINKMHPNKKIHGILVKNINRFS